MLLIASIIVCCSLIALLENETVSLVEPSWVKLSLPDTATYDATYNTTVSYTHLTLPTILRV